MRNELFNDFYLEMSIIQYLRQTTLLHRSLSINCSGRFEHFHQSTNQFYCLQVTKYLDLSFETNDIEVYLLGIVDCVVSMMLNYPDLCQI